LFPQIFGKYVLERSIAVGGMARVFLATLRGAGGFEKKLVVKQIRAELATDEAFVRRFVAEAKTTVELSHPNIVPVYELGVEQGVYYLAMELCDGVTLAELVEKAGPLAPNEGAYVGIEICRALDYAHRRAKIIHRDVTPRNVLIDEEGGVRLIDFGIAAPAFAGAKEIFGSPGHMPPEQLSGGELGPPTDVFAVAALLYEAWSGRAPFRRETPEACERALTERVPQLSTIDPALAPLDDLVASALSPDAARRPQSADDLSRPLRRFLANADLGDLAKKVGSRVAGLKMSASAGLLDASEVDADSPERPSSPDITRTFATRQLDSTMDAPSQKPAGQGGAEIATRRMSESAGWSTGKRRAARKRIGTLSIAAIAAVGLAAAAMFGRTALQGTSTHATNALDDAATPSNDVPSGAGSSGDIDGRPTTVSSSSDSATIAAGEPVTAHESSHPTGTNNGTLGTAGPAHLRILATPEATVEVDGKSRGSAPIGDLVVTPGTHFVRLDCGPLGEAVSQNVRVSAGESVTVSGDFTGAHGRILVRRAGR